MVFKTSIDFNVWILIFMGVAFDFLLFKFALMLVNKRKNLYKNIIKNSFNTSREERKNRELMIFPEMRIEEESKNQNQLKLSFKHDTHLVLLLKGERKINVELDKDNLFKNNSWVRFLKGKDPYDNSHLLINLGFRFLMFPFLLSIFQIWAIYFDSDFNKGLKLFLKGYKNLKKPILTSDSLCDLLNLSFFKVSSEEIKNGCLVFGYFKEYWVKKEGLWRGYRYSRDHMGKLDLFPI